jgi:F-type H+-transporting ATPase subunit delta
MTNEKNLLIADKYAESLIELGKDGKLSYEIISKNLDDVKLILEKSPDLFAVLTNPLVSGEDKIDIVDCVFSNEIDVLVKNFLKILVEKNRFNIINEVIEVYFAHIDVINNVQKITVVSAVELNDGEKSKIQDKLATKLNKTVKTTWNIDDSIIAGLVIKIGDNVIDMSLNHKLEDMKKTITK